MRKITLLIMFFFISYGFMAKEGNLSTLNNKAFSYILELKQNKEPFSIYPNPATKGFVNILSETNDPKEIFIFDVLGKEIIKTILKGNRLDISTLESGIYILKVTQGQYTTTKKLIVK